MGDITGVRDYLYDRERLSAEHLGAWYGGLVLTSLPDDTTAQNTITNRVPGRPAGFALGYVPVVNGVPQTQDMAREMKVGLGYDDFGRPSTVAVSHGGQSSASFAYDYTPNSSFWRSRSSGLFRQERTPETNRDLLKSSAVLWGSTVVTRHIHTTNDAGELASIAQHGALYSDYGDDQGATSWAFGYRDTGELTSATSHLGAMNGPTLPGRSYVFDYDTAGNRQIVGIDAHQSGYLDESNTPGANALNQVRQRRSLPGRVTGTAHADAVINVAGSGVSRPSGARYWDAVLAGWGRLAEFSVSALRNGQMQSGAGWRLIRPEWETVDYDEEGNLIADSLWRYHYDAENRLVQMSTRSAGELSDRGWQIAPPAHELNFKYDHLGRRVEKTVRKNGIIIVNRRFVYEGWNPIAEFELANGVPNVRRSYAWGLDIAGSLDATGGIGALVLQTIHQGSARSHYHVATDGHGSVTALLDPNGTAVAAYEYDPFGQPLRAEGATAPETLGSTDQPGDNPFRYSNKYWDRETGLYDYGLRFYDPSLGRFINRDPIAEAGGTNLYAFAGNNPVNRWDYLGLDDRARPFGPEVEFWGPTPESPGEDGSYRGRGRVDIRDNAEFQQNWGTDGPNNAPQRSYWEERNEAFPANLSLLIHQITTPLRILGQIENEAFEALKPAARVVLGAAGSQAIDNLHRATIFVPLPIGKTTAAARIVRVGESDVVAARVATEVATLERRVVFGQRRIDPNFSLKEGVPDFLAGRPIADVAADLRAGVLSPDKLPVRVFEHKGSLVALNNRSLAALSEAGMVPTQIISSTPTNAEIARLFETPIIRSPIPGPLIPVTPGMSNPTVLRVIGVP